MLRSIVFALSFLINLRLKHVNLVKKILAVEKKNDLFIMFNLFWNVYSYYHAPKLASDGLDTGTW